MRYREFKIVEALLPSQYRNLVKGWDRQRYAEIFKNPQYRHDRKGYRVYIPIESSQSADAPKSPTQTQIERFLDENGFDLVDYVKGIVYNREKKQNIKIGRVLNKLKATDLLNAFNVDKTREGKKSEYMAVISRHPYDIAGQSTDRGWTSCMNLKNGGYNNYVPLDIREGTVIAYVTRVNDTNLENPTGRVSIKPFVDILGKAQVYFGIENQVYGSSVPGFIETVRKWVNQVNQTHELDDVAVLKFNPRLYHDSGLATQTHITGKKLSQDQRERLQQLIQSPKQLLKISDPTDIEIITASSEDIYVYRDLMDRPEFTPSESVQQTMAAMHVWSISLALDKGITPSPAVIRAGIQAHGEHVLRDLTMNNVEIPVEFAEIAVEKRAGNIRYFDIEKLNTSAQGRRVLLSALREPTNLSAYMNKITVTDQMIHTALKNGYNFKRIASYLRDNNRSIDQDLVKSALSSADRDNAIFILDYNQENPDQPLPVTEEMLKDYIINYYQKTESYNFWPGEMVNRYNITFKENQVLEIIRETESFVFLKEIRKNQEFDQNFYKKCVKYVSPAIQYVEDPDYEMQKSVIEKVPHYALDYIKNPSPELQLLAVSKAPQALNSIKNPTLEMFEVAARHKMKNVNWDQGESDMLDMNMLVAKLEDSDFPQDEIDHILKLSISVEPQRFIDVLRLDHEFASDPELINSLVGKLPRLFTVLLKDGIPPTKQVILYELNFGYYKPFEIVDKLKYYNRYAHESEKIRFDKSFVTKMLNSLSSKESSSFIVYLISENLTDADPALVKYALKNSDDKFWMINRFLDKSIIDSDDIKTAFSSGIEKYDYLETRRFFKNIERNGIAVDKELLESFMKNIQDPQYFIITFLELKKFIEPVADDDFRKMLIDKDDEIIRLMHLIGPVSQEIIDYAYEKTGVWVPLHPGDMVRATNPNAKPRFPIEQITKTGYILSLDGDQREFPAERIHRVNGIKPPAGYKYDDADSE